MEDSSVALLHRGTRAKKFGRKGPRVHPSHSALLIVIICYGLGAPIEGESAVSLARRGFMQNLRAEMGIKRAAEWNTWPERQKEGLGRQDAIVLVPRRRQDRATASSSDDSTQIHGASCHRRRADEERTGEIGGQKERRIERQREREIEKEREAAMGIVAR